MQIKQNLHSYFLASGSKPKLTRWISVIFLLTLFSCDTGKHYSSEEKPSEWVDAEGYEYEMKNFNKSSSLCGDGQCTQVNISYPEFSVQNKNETILNARIKTVIHSMLSDYVMNAGETDNIITLSDKFLSSYEEFRKQFPEAKTPWYIDLKAVLSHQNTSFMCVRIAQTSYTGGVHSNHELVYKNWDDKGNEIKELNYFFTSTDDLKAIAENVFRKVKKIPSDMSLADKGYTFEGNKFQFPNQFGFNNTGLILYYNAYEIDDYSNGATEIVIPFADLTKIYRFD